MAKVYAVKSGNWSDTSVWNTGSLPDVTDDVYTNTYIVEIDQDIEVNMLTNEGDVGAGISANGRFQITTTGTYNIVVTDEIRCNGTVANTGYSFVYISANNSIVNVSADKLNFLGGAGTMNFMSIGGANTICTVYANDIYAQYVGIGNTSLFSINAGDLTVYGTISGSGRYVYVFSALGKFTHYGLMKAPTTFPYITGTLSNDCYLNGIELGIQSLYGGSIAPRFIDPFVIVNDQNNNPVLLTDPNQQDYPIEADVRDSVLYNNGTLEGTLVVPDVTTVAKDVVFDNGTKGTAILTEQAVANAVAGVVGAEFNGFKG